MTEQEQIDEIQTIIDDCWESDSIDAEYGYINTEEAAKTIFKTGYRKVDEIKRLEKENACLLKACEEQFIFDTTENKKYSIFNSVRKVFAEKIKQRSYCDNCFKDGKWHRYIFLEDVDELLKEYEK